MYDLMIVGGGPAGLAAAVYAARKRLDTLLITSDIGGQINWTLGIENYLGYQFIEGPELIAKFQKQIDQFPIGQKIGQKVVKVNKTDAGFEVLSDKGEKYEGKAALIATGKRARRLNVPGEDKLIGRGVAFCATCDGPVFAGQKVAVVGGGNSALEAALDMVKIAEHVDLVSLTPLRGDPILIEKLADAKNLTTYLEYQTEEVTGQELVEGLKVKELKTGASKVLDVTGIFVEIGLVPNSEPVQGLVELNKSGEVIVSCSCETSVPGVFAAGDMTTVTEKQIAIAVGEGAKAALTAHRYLQHLV